jgi:hypothetical protein
MLEETRDAATYYVWTSDSCQFVLSWLAALHYSTVKAGYSLTIAVISTHQSG